MKGQPREVFPTKPLKHLVVLRRSHDAGSDEALPYVGLENIEPTTGRLIEDSVTDKGPNLLETNSDGRQSIVFRSGDVLFGRLRPYLAKALLAEFPGRCTTEALIMEPHSINPRFLRHVCLSAAFTNAVDASTFGSKMPRAEWDFVGSLQVPIPKSTTQVDIANHLDRETARLNALIVAKQRLLALLAEKCSAIVTRGLDARVRLKPSGVEWLGDVPVHWSALKIAHGFRTIGSGTTPKSGDSHYYGGDVPWVTTSELRECVIDDTIQKVTTAAMQDHSALHLHPRGTLLIAMYGATIGRLGILGLPATVNQACVALADALHFEVRFVFYWFQMRKPALIALSAGGGQPNLSQEDIRQIKIPAPSIDEQCAIVAYLDRETTRLDVLMAKARKVIDLLKEHRAALISAAITGRIAVGDGTEGQSK